MNPLVSFSILLGYFGILYLISFFTSKNISDKDFYNGSQQSPWYVVAYGMIGASLSGVTFLSVPGWVGASSFTYMQMVGGYFIGYLVIAYVLLPIYYKLNLISIYSYLDQRLGIYAYKTGAAYFLISRVIGASFRLYLVAGVLHIVLLKSIGVPFFITVMISILLIWIYTSKGGIKTVVWTDTLQTTFMLLSAIITLIVIANKLDFGTIEFIGEASKSGYAKVFDWDVKSDSFFGKHFISGAFIAIVMTGLDQDMMQKNLTCKSLGDAQKNMLWFSSVLIIVNLLFLLLGAALYLFVDANNLDMPAKADQLFTYIAIENIGGGTGTLFLLGVVAAAYSSADSALTSLTTSFCVDFLEMDGVKKSINIKTRKNVHIMFSVILFFVIVLFDALNDDTVISNLFKAAGYTYGPLLGMFSFALIKRNEFKRYQILMACIFPPILSYLLNKYSSILLNGYEIGFELLLINGGLTFLMLVLFSKNNFSKLAA